jgi:hypothetical protein
MINVTKKSNKTKNAPTLKFTTLSLMSLLTLFKTCKVQIFVKLEFKLILSSIFHTFLIKHRDKFTFKVH